MLKGDIGRGVDRLAGQKSGAVLPEQLSERTFPALDRLSAEIFPVELEEIEGVQLG